MIFIPVGELRNDFLKSTPPEEDVVLTARGRPVAILTIVDENSFEKELDAIKRSRALKALDSQVVSIGLREIDDDLNDYKAAKKQAIAYLKKGFHIGGRGILSREELHER